MHHKFGARQSVQCPVRENSRRGRSTGAATCICDRSDLIEGANRFVSIAMQYTYVIYVVYNLLVASFILKAGTYVWQSVKSVFPEEPTNKYSRRTHIFRKASQVFRKTSHIQSVKIGLPKTCEVFPEDLQTSKSSRKTSQIFKKTNYNIQYLVVYVRTMCVRVSFITGVQR